MRTTSNIIGFILCGVLLTLVILTGISDYQKSQLETDEVERGEFLEEITSIAIAPFAVIDFESSSSCDGYSLAVHLEFPDEAYEITCEQFRELFKEFLIK